MTAESGTEVLQTYRTAPLRFPLHVVDEDGDALCGNLAGDQERFIENNDLDILPTVEEKRDGERWFYFLGDLCGTCRSSLLSQVDDDEIHDDWEEYQEVISQ